MRNWSNGALTLENVTIQNNAMPLSGGGVCHQGAGALTVLTSTIYSNVATNGSGGGIYDSSTSMTIRDSRVLSNTVNGPFGAGGGVWTSGSNFFKQILNSTVAYNRANGDGGGLYNAATANVSFSALANNTATSNGGGAHNATGGTLSSENNTFSGNSAPNGGGLNVEAGSSAYLTFTTVASNTAGDGINVSTGGTAEVYATLLAYNAGFNCVGGVTDNGFSMSSDASCSFAFNNIATLLLQPLALNVGQTLNHALSPRQPGAGQRADSAVHRE